MCILSTEDKVLSKGELTLACGSSPFSGGRPGKAETMSGDGAVQKDSGLRRAGSEKASLHRWYLNKDWGQGRGFQAYTWERSLQPEGTAGAKALRQDPLLEQRRGVAVMGEEGG